jgi:hypothetical protein
MWPFRKKEVKEEPVFLDDPENYASIKFTVENGETNIEIDWKCEDENEDDIALELGCLLSDINAGKYAPEIVVILDEYIKTDSENKGFVEDVALIWKESNDLRFQQKQSILDEPLVHPLKVFRQSSIFRE